ncbi:MAG: hypothetical protein ACUVS1_09020 [Actinomycetota bacterium]
MEGKTKTEEYEPRAFREGYTVEELNQILEEWNYVCNYVRTHQGLDYLTSMEFLNSWMEGCKEGVALFAM